MRRFALALLLMPSVALGQSVTLQEIVTGKPGHWVILSPVKVDGGPAKWRLDPAMQEVDVSAVFEGAKPKGKIITIDSPGRYKYEAWNAKGDVASDIAVGWVVILGPPPPPIPPAPSPAPIPVAGFRVLVVFEATGGNPLLTRNQMNEIYGAEVATYLNAKCAKDSKGKADWRIWDKDTPMANAPELWRQAMGRNRTQVPWIIISDGISSAGSFEGPLPDGGIMTLLRKYGG